MKKFLTVTAFSLMAGTVSVFAQGSIHFDDYEPAGVAGADDFIITVWSPQGDGSAADQVQGNSSTDLPAGTTVYTGVPIGGSASGSGPTGWGNGNDYTIALYAAAGAVTSGLTAVPGASANFDTTGIAPGQWDIGGGVVVTVPQVAAGAEGSFQLNAWYSGNGSITWAEASTPGSGDPYGSSIIADITLPGATAPPSTTLNPITSFSLINPSIPEPSTVALGVIGASAFLMRLRRK